MKLSSLSCFATLVLLIASAAVSREQTMQQSAWFLRGDENDSTTSPQIRVAATCTPLCITMNVCSGPSLVQGHVANVPTAQRAVAYARCLSTFQDTCKQMHCG